MNDEQPKGLSVPVQWVAVSFPKTAANCGKFIVQTLQEIMGSKQRDVFRHLVDDDAQGHMVFIPFGADPSSVHIPTEPPPRKLKNNLTPSALMRFKFGLIWDQGTDHSEDQEDYYQRRMRELNIKLDQELEDIRRANYYENEMS